jgi:hypothetical protein
MICILVSFTTFNSMYIKHPGITHTGKTHCHYGLFDVLLGYRSQKSL